MPQTFEAACKVAADQCGLDLRHQVLQVHKDYAKGIEASRMKIFPHARRCDDYLHMRRAAYSTLQKLFGVGQEKSGLQNQKAWKHVAVSMLVMLKCETKHVLN